MMHSSSKSLITLGLLLGSLLSFPMASAADDLVAGPYVQASGSYLLPSDLDIKTNTGRFNGSVDLDNDVGAFVALGYQWSFSDIIGLRAELEYGYRSAAFGTALTGDVLVDGTVETRVEVPVDQNCIPMRNQPCEVRIEIQEKDALVPNPVNAPVTGEITAHTLMANGYYAMGLDFLIDGLSQYIGGGVGAAFHSLNVPIVTPERRTPFLVQDDDITIAYQATVGMAYDMTDEWEVHVGYRYFGTADPQLSMAEVSYSMSQVDWGLRYLF